MTLRLLLCAAILCVSQHAFAEETYQTVETTVRQVESANCSDGIKGCMSVSLQIDTGMDQVEMLHIVLDPRDEAQAISTVQEGDRLVVQTAIVNGERVSFISDTVRRPALFWLFMLFILLTFLLGGKEAVRPFAGMIASLTVLFGIMIPLFLAGFPPLAVGLGGSFLIMSLTFFLGHAKSKKVIAAFAGTAISLCLTTLLAFVFSFTTKLTGKAEEEMLFLLTDYPDLNTRGILLAGIVIGCLGVLDDITISQSSAVFELKKANRLLTIKELYTRALRIGSDHIAAAINTLILAYAGASLPLLLLLIGIQGGESIGIFLNREIIAEEIVRTLVGSMGLLLAVPSTTWIASVMASGMKAEEIEVGHVH